MNNNLIIVKMRTKYLIGTIIFFVGGFCLFAQDSPSNGKALNFPAEKYGISIGNSYEFNGLRINFADKNVKVINGLNLTFWLKLNENSNAEVNGVSIGVLPNGGTMRYINLGILGTGAVQNISGLNIGGGFVGCGGNINGLTLSGITTMADGENSHINGIAVSGIGVGTKGTINGVAIGGIAVGTERNIKGLAAGLAYISAKQKLNGVALTLGYLESQKFNGVSVAGFSKSNQMNGLSVALINKTENLRGIQLGLLNFAENNPKWLRVLPLINFHF